MNLANPQNATNAVINADAAAFVDAIRSAPRYPAWSAFATNTPATLTIQVNSLTNNAALHDWMLERAKDDLMTRRILLKVLRYLDKQTGE